MARRAENRFAVFFVRGRTSRSADRKISLEGSSCETEVKIGIGTNQIADLNLCNPGIPSHQRGDFRPASMSFGLLYSRFCPNSMRRSACAPSLA